MRTKIFYYKGIVGIQSGIHAEGLLNDPMKKGQLGFVVDAAFVDVSPEALEALKTIRKSADCIGDVDISQSADKVVIHWLGGPLKAFRPCMVTGSRDYDASLITTTLPVEIDPEFIKMVDANP